MAKIFTFILLIFLVSQSRYVVNVSQQQSSEVPLGSLCQQMWDKTEENLKVPLDLEFNRQDPEKGPLFALTKTGEAKIDSIVFKTFKALLSSPEETSLQDKFFDAIMTGNGPMDEAYNYLKTKQHIRQTMTKERFECKLRDMWFAGHAKGFVHVFVGEKKADEFQGLHNWYQFYLEQEKNTIAIDSINSIEFSYNTEPNLMRLKFKWDTLEKLSADKTSMFVGTSPAFEFALFSVCSLAFKEVVEKKQCTCQIHNSQLKLMDIDSTSYSGRVYTAYPLSATADVKCSIPGDRTKCGFPEASHYACVKRGCCFDSHGDPTKKPWCFYPSDHKCHSIDPEKRVACPNKENKIYREICEQHEECCFDSSIPNVPFCFYARGYKVPKGPGKPGNQWYF